jgi:hypothetical protein
MASIGSTRFANKGAISSYTFSRHYSKKMGNAFFLPFMRLICHTSCIPSSTCRKLRFSLFILENGQSRYAVQIDASTVPRSTASVPELPVEWPSIPVRTEKLAKGGFFLAGGCLSNRAVSGRFWNEMAAGTLMSGAVWIWLWSVAFMQMPG